MVHVSYVMRLKLKQVFRYIKLAQYVLIVRIQCILALAYHKYHKYIPTASGEIPLNQCV